MCEKCIGNGYCSVRSLFNGDLQVQMRYLGRKDWLVVSSEVIVYLGVTSMRNEENVLFRGCENAIDRLTESDRKTLLELSKELARPAFGTP